MLIQCLNHCRATRVELDGYELFGLVIKVSLSIFATLLM